MDLIYEGITTSLEFLLYFTGKKVRMDLIYEGITTPLPQGPKTSVIVRMDLIYEGITT